MEGSAETRTRTQRPGHEVPSPTAPTALICLVCAQVSNLLATGSRNMRWRRRITDGAATESHAAEWEPDSEVEPQRWCEERNAGHQGWWAATPRAAASWDATGGTWGAAEWKSQGWWQPEATPRAAASWDATVGAYSWSSSTSTWAGAASAEPTEGIPFASETVMVQEVVVVAKKMVATRVLRTRPTSAQGTEEVVDATETEVTTVLRTLSMDGMAVPATALRAPTAAAPAAATSCAAPGASTAAPARGGQHIPAVGEPVVLAPGASTAAAPAEESFGSLALVGIPAAAEDPDAAEHSAAVPLVAVVPYPLQEPLPLRPLPHFDVAMAPPAPPAHPQYVAPPPPPPARTPEVVAGLVRHAMVQPPNNRVVWVPWTGEHERPWFCIRNEKYYCRMCDLCAEAGHLKSNKHQKRSQMGSGWPECLVSMEPCPIPAPSMVHSWGDSGQYFEWIGLPAPTAAGSARMAAAPAAFAYCPAGGAPAAPAACPACSGDSPLPPPPCSACHLQACMCPYSCKRGCQW